MRSATTKSDVQTLVDVLEVARSAAGQGVIAAGGGLTAWNEVADRADQLGAALRNRGVRRGDRVALLLPKSLESFVAVHAVLRAGAVAVPLDPLTTPRAVVPVLDVVAPRLLISTTALAARFAPAEFDLGAIPVMVLDDDDVASGDDGGLEPVRPDDAAYILFTSGSTGRPKGIVHTHRSALAYASRAVDEHELDRRSRLAATAPLHFDMSTLELYSVPLAGGTVVTVTEADERFPATLAGLLDATHATHLYAVPSLLHQILEHGALEPQSLAALRHIAFAGEPMGAALLGAWMDQCPDATFLNAYGPAEVNVVTSHRFEPGWDRRHVPIGAAWPDVQTRVVDDHGDLVDADLEGGATGELLVSAPSCMQGYWRLNEETERRIATDPDGRRWYRTGDVVHNDGGVFTFLGRRDNQVKVRGVRIEVEAVEHTLCSEPTVAQALVELVVDEHGVASLRAWVVPVAGASLDRRHLLRWCRSRLARAAVPAEINVVPSLPVTANGKLDRSAVGRWAAATSAATTTTTAAGKLDTRAAR